MRRHLCLLLLVLLTGEAWPRVARADGDSVARAQNAYQGLRFEDVLAEIAQARRFGGLSRADETELTRLEAYTYAIYNDRARAVDAFRRLLALAPTWVPPAETSPKIRRYYEEAQRTSGRPAAHVAAPPPTV